MQNKTLGTAEVVPTVWDNCLRLLVQGQLTEQLPDVRKETLLLFSFLFLLPILPQSIPLSHISSEAHSILHNHIQIIHVEEC